jgi:hypothetical protein
MTDVSGAALGPDGFRVDTPDANRANFDRAQAGFDWDRTGAWLAREGLDGSVHTMTINPPHDWTGVIELATSQTASSLGGCAGVQCVVTDAAGHVVYSTQGYESAAGSGGRFRVSGADGPFTWTVTYAGAGQQTFNCLHHP